MSMSSSPARAKAEPTAFPYREVTHAGGRETQGSSVQEQQSREDAARAAGVREGEERARVAYQIKIEECRKSIAAALEEFARQRSQYFLAVERETVHLALAIARKILHREAQVDPYLLAGMVRVALDRVRDAGKVTVRVNPLQASDFRIFFAQQIPENQPEVLEEPSIDSSGCLLETSLGKTAIGPEIQLKEIEQGLLDLQAARPR